MSSTQCNYFHCFNRKKKEKNLSFFSFPIKDRKQFKLWRKYSGNPELIGKTEEELKSALICEKHFKEKDIIIRDKRKLLQPHAVPIPWKGKMPGAIIKQEKVEVKKEKSSKSSSEPKKDKSFGESKKDKSLGDLKRDKAYSELKKEKTKIKSEPKPSRHKQVEVVVEPRTSSKRAASKRALSQMQVLLEDEADTVEIPDDDDDVIPILDRIAPPRKKYKVSHRKSSEGGEILVLKNVNKQQERLPTITNHYVENNLELECWNEDLEPCQIARNEQLAKEEEEIQKKLDELIKACKGEVIYQGNLTSLIEIGEEIQKTIQSTQAAAKAAAQQQQLILNSQVANAGAYQLVMDPRLGLVAVQPPAPPQKQLGQVKVAQNLTATPPPAPRSRNRNRAQRGTPVASSPPPLVARTPPVSQKQTNKRVTVQTPTVTPSTRSTRASGLAAPSPGFTENNVVGGLATGPGAIKPKAFVDLTSDDGKPLPDSREVSFNKLQGKTYPSLVVVARPHMRVTDVNIDRAKLDAKVKQVLMFQPTKFTEWLIQQGLVKADQRCGAHTNQLKLGMYSDVSKFPYSGGYVWISDCCPQKFVSVFSGSIFEGSPHPPLTILKLLYHWSCQTNVQNVVQWVKVDNLYVKGMFTWLRSICTTALHTHVKQLGGPGSKVEVGVISLGTTSQDGNSRQVKVEVLGVMESGSKLIRLRAIEPLADGDRNYRKRFAKILEPLTQWVHPSSMILTDMTVDKATLNNMGFPNVMQAVVNDNNSNKTIMEYLRRIVPRMFQNTLSLLSRQIIQQFLDELVWREWFGTTSMDTFDNLVTHLSEQTRFDSGQSLIVRLNRVAQNPFKNWAVPGVVAESPQKSLVEAKKPTRKSRGGKDAELPKTPAPKTPAPKTPAPKTPAPKTPAPKAPTPKTPAPKTPTPKTPAPKTPTPKPATIKPGPKSAGTKPVGPKSATSAPKTSTESSRPPKPTSPDVPEQMVPLENYYYGTIDHYPSRANIKLNITCPYCREVFNNNLALMGHLFKHAHSILDGEMCRYCLTSTTTANDLVKHIATSHPQETKFDNGFMCLICESTFMNPFILGKHMSKDHSPLELPYQCGTCGYRCSNHKQAIDHFYKQHDNGPTIQCPFCLKSTTVFSSSRNITQNINFFVQHLQKHQRKLIAKRCGKCNLWFVQKDILKEHQTKMHASQRGKLGLVPWPASKNGVMVPKSKMDRFPGDGENINFDKLVIDVASNMVCRECNTSLDSPKHFPSFEHCQNQNCQFATCCAKAMQDHLEKCSKHALKEKYEEKLPYTMFCVCGYSSDDGNRLAEHLAICERKSAYHSLEESKTASVTHSMLDILGLVRRPEESERKARKTKTDIESLDSPVVLDDDSDEVKMETEEKTEKGNKNKAEDVELKVAVESARKVDEADKMDTDDVEMIESPTESVPQKSEVIAGKIQKVSKTASPISIDDEESPDVAEPTKENVEESNKVSRTASPVTVEDETDKSDEISKTGSPVTIDGEESQNAVVSPTENIEESNMVSEEPDSSSAKDGVKESDSRKNEDPAESAVDDIVDASVKSRKTTKDSVDEELDDNGSAEPEEIDQEPEEQDPEEMASVTQVGDLNFKAKLESLNEEICIKPEDSEDVIHSESEPVNVVEHEEDNNTNQSVGESYPEAVSSTVEDKQLASNLQMEDISPGNFDSGSLDAYVNDNTEKMDTEDISPPESRQVGETMQSDNAMETESFYNDIE